MFCKRVRETGQCSRHPVPYSDPSIIEATKGPDDCKERSLLVSPWMLPELVAETKPAKGGILQ